MKIRKNVETVQPYVYRPLGERSSSHRTDERPNGQAQEPLHSDVKDGDLAKKKAPEKAPTHEDGYKAGLEEGYEKGFQEGAKEAEQQLTSALEEHFNSLLEAMQVGAEAVGKEAERLREQFEAWLPRAVLLVSEAVLQREVATNVSALIPVIQSCLADLPQGEPISVRLNPADHQVLCEQPAELWDNERLTFVPDAAVSRGGAVVEGGSRVVDARLESRLLETARQLLFPADAATDDDGQDAT